MQAAPLRTIQVWWTARDARMDSLTRSKKGLSSYCCTLWQVLWIFRDSYADQCAYYVKDVYVGLGNLFQTKSELQVLNSDITIFEKIVVGTFAHHYSTFLSSRSTII